jgi:hypothetical protein
MKVLNLRVQASEELGKIEAEPGGKASTGCLGIARFRGALSSGA